MVRVQEEVSKQTQHQSQAGLMFSAVGLMICIVFTLGFFGEFISKQFKYSQWDKQEAEVVKIVEATDFVEGKKKVGLYRFYRVFEKKSKQEQILRGPDISNSLFAGNLKQGDKILVAHDSNPFTQISAKGPLRVLSAPDVRAVHNSVLWLVAGYVVFISLIVWLNRKSKAQAAMNEDATPSAEPNPLV
jgi:hypothetical protein